MLLTIRSMYDGVKSSVIVNGRLTAWFDIDIGLRQGCVLSPLLFLIFVNDLIKEFKKSDTGVLVGEVRINNLAFADDIVLTANDEDELQELVTIAENYAQAWKFAFNTKKCKIMVFNGRKKKPKIFLEGERLEIVNAYKYLGVWFDTKLDWKLHKETILAKAKRRAYTMVGFGACKILPVKASTSGRC